MKVSLSLLLVNWLTLAASEGVEHVFPANAETAYKWSTEVSTGATIPGSNDNHASYFAFNGNLHVRTDTTNKVLFKVENMAHSAYNGPVKEDKSPKEEHKFIEICKDCGTVFAAIYEKGKITHIELDESDKLYIKNKKRAILSQFQLDFEHIPSEQAFTSFEQGVTGLCHLEQSVDFHQNKSYVSLRKFLNNNKCTGRPQRKENLSFNQCGHSSGNPVSHTTERNYKLGKKDKLFVKTIKSRSGVITQPQGLETETYFHVTTQNLEMVLSSPVNSDAWTIGKTYSTSLIFEFPEDNLETGEDIDVSFGSIVYDPEVTINKTMAILKTLGEHVKSKDTYNRNPEQIHALDMKREIATGFLRAMNTDSLTTLAEMIVNTEDRTTRNIALEVLPRIGTLAAARVINGLKEKVKKYEFDGMILELPFNLRQRSLELLEVFKDLMNSTRPIEILAYSAIIGEVCEKILCPDVFDLIKTFFEKMQASEDYGTKLLYLQALGNIHLDPVAKYLEPIIRDKVNYPHTLRYTAIQAAYPTQVTRPDKAHALYWPIFQDKTEHHDMRLAALIILTVSNPTTERFLNLLSYINSTEDPDIYNMFYTNVQSLFKIKHPCFKQLSISVDEVIRLMPKRKVPSYASFTSIMDYENPENGNGLKFQTIMMSDKKTGFPNILYLDSVPHYNGVVGNAMSLHLRMDGDALRDIIGDATNWAFWNSNNDFNIRTLLQSLGVTARDPTPTHMEIIMKRNGRTVFCEYMNTYIVFAMKTLLERRVVDSSIDIDTTSRIKFNSQFLDQSTTFETVVANDVGIPVTLYMKQTGLLSLVGDVTIIDRKNSSLQPNFSLRYLGHKSEGVYSLNPAMSLWHGVSRSRTEDFHLHLDAKYSVFDIIHYHEDSNDDDSGSSSSIEDSNTKSTADSNTKVSNKSLALVMEWNNDNTPLTAISHVNTMTYLKGAGAEFGSLDVMCPKCEVYHIVSSKPLQNVSVIETAKHDSQFQFQYDVFDCEHPHEIKDKQSFYNVFSSIAHTNVRSSIWLKPLLGLMAMPDLYDHTPTSGSCGQSIRVNSIGKASKLEIILFELEKKIEIHSKDANGKSLKSWSGIIVFNTTSTKRTVENSFIVQLRRKIEHESFDVTCFKMNLETSKERHDARKFNLLYEPHENLVSVNVRNVEIIIGQSADGKCPEKTKSQISISSASSWKKPKSDILAKCEEDRGNNRLYPATENCFKAAKHISNARNLSINVKTNNLNTELGKFRNSLVSTIHRILPETVPERLPSEFNVDLKFDGEGKFATWVTGAENPGKWYDIELPDFIKYYLDGQPIGSIYSMQTCYAAGDHIYTYDGTSIKYNAVPKWTLLTAHCVDMPTFAVFIRKIEGSDMLSLRFHLFDDVVEVTPTESKPSIMINDKPFESYNDTTMPDHLWSKVEDEYFYMTMRRIPVLIFFSNKYIEVTTTYDLAGWTCGMCGDYNQWPETSLNFPGPDGKPVNLEDVSRVYTLP